MVTCTVSFDFLYILNVAVLLSLL